MPKLGKFFDTQVTFDTRDELREKLVAISYLRGYGGRYAPIARDIMAQAVERYVEDLDPAEKKAFADILKSVQAVTIVEKMEREERRSKRAQAAADPD